MKVSIGIGIAAAAGLIGVALADELKPPPMRDGLWESHTTQIQHGKTVVDMTMKLCQAKEIAKSNQAISAEFRKANQCTSNVSQPSANTFVTETRCAKGANAGSMTKVVYTFHGDTASHMEIHMPDGNSETVSVTDMKYLGSCPAGTKPGDAVMDGGIKK
jgi:hypothetical protein